MGMESKDNIKRNKGRKSKPLDFKNNFLYAVSGIKYAIKNEKSFKIIILAIIVTTAVGFIYQISAYEWLFVVVSFALVTGSELLNTAIEAVVDLETTDYHALAKIAKDCGSAATLIFSIMSLIEALIIFIPKIF